MASLPLFSNILKDLHQFPAKNLLVSIPLDIRVEFQVKTPKSTRANVLVKVPRFCWQNQPVHFTWWSSTESEYRARNSALTTSGFPHLGRKWARVTVVDVSRVTLHPLELAAETSAGGLNTLLLTQCRCLEHTRVYILGGIRQGRR